MQTQILIALYYFLPVWAFIIHWLPIKTKENNKVAYVLTELFLLTLTTQLAYFPFKIKKISFWLHYYSLAIMIYLLVLGYRNKFTKFPKILSYSLWMAFIVGDLWELPVFLYDIIFLNGWHNIASFNIWAISHVHRAYILATFLMFAYLSKFEFNRDNLKVLASSIGLGFILLHPTIRTLTTSIITRILTLGLFLLIVILGIPNET